MLTPAKKVAKKAGRFVIDKILNSFPTALLTAVLTLSGFIAQEWYKGRENRQLEKYKLDIAANLEDSKEFVKSAEIVWAKALAFRSEVSKLSSLYSQRNQLSTRYKQRNQLSTQYRQRIQLSTLTVLPSDILGLNKEEEKEIDDLNARIERQRSVLQDAKMEFYNILYQHEFYLGQRHGFQFALYVETSHDLIQDEELIDDIERDLHTFEEKLVNSRADRFFDSSWKIILGVALKVLPWDPDTEALLPQELQLIQERERQAEQQAWEESRQKLREDTFGAIRKNAAANRKAREERLQKLWFDAAAARRYSLDHKP